MNIYYQIRGGHVHLRLFNHDKLGDLCMRIEEFFHFKEDLERLDKLTESSLIAPFNHKYNFTEEK